MVMMLQKVFIDVNIKEISMQLKYLYIIIKFLTSRVN